MSMNSRQERAEGSRRRQRWVPLLALLVSPAGLATPVAVEAEHGVLHVSGSLTESACRLDMRSAYQAVDMGNIGTAELRQAGDQSMPVRVQLHLQDCLRGASNNRDKLGNLTWSANIPSVSFSFSGLQDPVNPALVKAVGVSGIGLRVMDKDLRDVGLGQRTQPLLLNPSNNDLLTYFITPERTAAPLMPGAYTALVMFRLNYE